MWCEIYPVLMKKINIKKKKSLITTLRPCSPYCLGTSPVWHPWQICYGLKGIWRTERQPVLLNQCETLMPWLQFSSGKVLILLSWFEQSYAWFTSALRDEAQPLFWALHSTGSVLQSPHFPIQAYFTYCWISLFITQLLIMHKESPAIILFSKWKITAFKSGLSLYASPLVKAHIQTILKLSNAILPDYTTCEYVQSKRTSVWKMNLIYSRNNLRNSINLASQGLHSKNQFLFTYLLPKVTMCYSKMPWNCCQ